MALQEPYDPTSSGLSEYEKQLLGLQRDAQTQARLAQQEASAIAERNRADALAAQGKQYDIDERNYTYMVERQKIDDQRADSKFQRSVRDARAAGLSPLAVLGNMSSAGNVVSQASGINPVVPQADATALVNAHGLSVHASTAMAGLKSDYLKEIKKIDSASELQDTKYKYESAMQTERLDAQFAQLREQLDANQQMNLDRIQADLKKHESDLSLAKQKMSVEESHEIGRSYEKAGYQVEYVNASSETISNHNLHAWNRINAATEIYLGYGIKKTVSSGSQLAAGASIPLGLGQSTGGNVQTGEQQSFSEDPTKIFEERLKQARARYPIYVYSPTGRKL